MEEDRHCSTCLYYEPFEGICKKELCNHKAYDGKECNDWRDWEDKW